jgi:hypothetical protein
MKRISSNESFPRNIVLSIDRDYDNLTKNINIFKRYFFEALGAGESPEKSVEIASEKLRQVVEKRESPTTKSLMLEGMREKRESTKKRKEEIISKFIEKTGSNDEELLKHLWRLFLHYRRESSFDSTALERVLSFYERKLKPEVVVESREYSEKELESYYDLIGSLEPRDKFLNVRIFDRLIKKVSAENAIDRIRHIVAARKFIRENGIVLNSTNLNIMLNASDFETAKSQIEEKEAEGRYGLDVGRIREPNDSDVFVDYFGERITLGRLVDYLYSNETIKTRKYAYKQLEEYIFGMGMSVDDAVARLNKVLRMIEFKGTLENMFPEDPSSAITIFAGYYIDDDLSFEDSLEATKKDLLPSN